MLISTELLLISWEWEDMTADGWFTQIKNTEGTDRTNLELILKFWRQNWGYPREVTKVGGNSIDSGGKISAFWVE